MRKITLLFANCLFQLAFAQAPQKFAYQGAARNASGNPIVNQLISIRASVIDGSPTGTIQYSETHNVNTNAMGLFNVEIGGGSILSGSFPAITWGGGTKYMKVEFDPTGGSSYTLVGTTQILSVPYALYAASSGNSSSLPTGTTGQTLRHDGSNWVANSNLTNNGSQVGIGTSPNSSAVLDVASTTGGFLAPRLTTVQRNAIVAPASGLMIYNIACGNFQYYDGTQWINFNIHPNNVIGTLGSVVGSSNVCAGSNLTYSVVPISGVTNYAWTVPVGSTITTGQGTNVINVNIGATSGNICVMGSNACNPTPSNTSCKAITVGSILADPIANSATSITDSTASLSWNVVGGATYALQVSTNSGFSSFVNGANGNWFSYTSPYIVRGLSCNTTYYYRVRAKNSCDTSNYSNTVSFTTPVASSVVANSAYSITTTGFLANWVGADINTLSYRLDVSLNPSFSSFVVGYNNLTVNFSLQSVNGLTTGTTYYYRVRRVTSCGTSANSNVVTVTTN
jgi:hypothetical protein